MNVREAVQGAVTDGVVSPWESFVVSTTAGERARSWLAVVCQRLAGVTAAAVLVENPDDHTFVPLAVWPAANADFGRLGGIVEAALREQGVSVKPADEPSQATQLAYPLTTGERVVGVIAVELVCPAGAGSTIDGALRELHWGSAWIANLLASRDLNDALRAKVRLESVLEATAVVLRHGKLRQALFELANALRQQLDCSRVAIGLTAGLAHSRVKLGALSEAASFEKHSALVAAYEEAMNEALDEGRVLFSPPVPGQEGDATGHVPAPRHDALRAVSGTGSALSYPLILGAHCVGIITLERAGSVSRPFGEDDLIWLEAFGAFAAPVIEQRRAAERHSPQRAKEELSALLARIFGPRHLTWKVATAGAALVAALLTLVQIEYRVSAKTVVEGEVQRMIAAPFEGFVGTAYVRAGDTVKSDQLLAQLDDRELRIEEAKWSSERDQHENRLREAMANHDLTAMQVVGAQLRQSSAQLDLVTEKIRRARMTAPFDGIVVFGDLSQQIGAPVETGKKLFEIAPLRSYRVILQVDEREIRHVRMDQAGRLVMTGIAGEPMDFKVANVTPVAIAQEGKNFFRVEAALAEASPRLRPGMEGVGKIEVGERSLWWILTHSLTDWLTLTLWNWIP